MANKNLLDFVQTTITGAGDYVHISQGGVDKRIKLSDFLAGLESGNPFKINIVNETSTYRLITKSDISSYIRCTNSSFTTIEVDSDLNQNFKVGDTFVLRKAGLGDVLITGVSGVTVNPAASGSTLSEIGQCAQVVKVGDDQWDIVTGGNATTVISGGATFATVATMKTGDTVEGGSVDYSVLAAQNTIVQTVWNNTTSKKGGEEYIIKTAAQVTADGDVIDGYGSHWLLGGNNYAAVLNHCGFVHVETFGAIADWNRDSRTGTDATAAIQAAINYAENFVNTVAGIDPKGGAEVVLCGDHGSGQFRVTSGLRVSKSNISLIFKNGAALATDFSNRDGGNCAVIIIGSAENWLSSNTISTTTKYNRVFGAKIVRTGGAAPIGIMSTGTRNLSLDNIHIEQLVCGLWLENTSELTSSNYSTIGCYWGLVGDSRKNRLASHSPLGVANVDNDCSSCVFTMFKAYYPQHTGVLLINSGTMSFYGSTVGRFSENPVPGNELIYGLPGRSVGVHIFGANTNFTKAGKLDGFVFEAGGAGMSKTCILLESPSTNNPIRGISIDGAHIQTFESNHASGVVTTLCEVAAYNGGIVDRCSLSNSGFTPQTSGYYYGNLLNRPTDADVGQTVHNYSLNVTNCYPSVALSTSNVARSNLNDFAIIERVDMEILDVSNMPDGWTLSAGSNATPQGGASGEQKYLRFSGNGGQLSYMYKTYNYRNYLSETNAVYVSLWYKGDTAPHIDMYINGDTSSRRTVNNSTNVARYSNAIRNKAQSSYWTRAVYCFNMFSVNHGFDNFRLELGRTSNGGTNYTDIKGVEVGYCKMIEDAYNTF